MPRELDAEIEDMASSNMSDLDETTAAAPADQQADDAASSPATGETEDNLLSVVRDVVSESRGQADAASPADGGDDSAGKGQQEPKGPDDENFTDVPFHKHPRFQQLLRKAKAHEQDAERYHNVVGFLDRAGLTDQEAADGLSIMGLAKTDPAEAWKQIKPWVQKLLIASGEALPDELRQRVQSGEMSQEAALELSRATARAQSMQASQSFREQQEQSRQQKAAANSLLTTAQTWEQDRFAKDPNFATKQTAVMKEILFLQQTEGRPNTPEGVKAQLDKAYKAVNASLRAPAPAAPQRQAVRPVTGGQVAGNQQPAAQSTLDIVRAHRRSG